MSDKKFLNTLIQQQELSRSLLRAEIIGLRSRLKAAHRQLARQRWPWYRRLAFFLRHPTRRIP
jgi:hypothetical protein